MRTIHAILALIVTVIVDEAFADGDAPLYRTHAYTNFMIDLPAEFERQPQKGYSDVFVFRPILISFQRRVPNASALQKMSDVEVMDVVFHSTIDGAQSYADFRPIKDGEWIGFNRTTGVPYGTYIAGFRIMRREVIDVPHAQAGAIVFYESRQPAEGSYADEMGNDTPAPIETNQHCAFIVDTGIWKYVFVLPSVPDRENLEWIKKGIQAFKETAEQGVAGYPPQGVGSPER